MCVVTNMTFSCLKSCTIDKEMSKNTIQCEVGDHAKVWEIQAVTSLGIRVGYETSQLRST